MDYVPGGSVDPLGRAVTRTLDDFGNLAGVELPDGAQWRFAHDALSRLTQITDPAGHSWQREYGSNGELTAVVDPTGVRQDYSADAAAGTSTVQDAFERTSVRFDEFGRPRGDGAGRRQHRTAHL